MKTSIFQNLSKAGTAAALALIIGQTAGCASAPSTADASASFTPGHVEIRAVTGEVQVAQDGDSSFQPSRLNQKVQAGQAIRTGDNSTADLFIPSVGVMRVTPSSVVRIKLLQVDKTVKPPLVNAEFELPEGRIQGNTMKMSPASVVKVTTPKGSYLIK